MSKTDWTDLDAVKAVLRRMNSAKHPQLIFKVAGRANFNITFVSRTDRYLPEEVVYNPNRKA